MPMSAYLRDKVLDHVYGGPAFPQPTSVWVKLHLADPGVNGLSNPATETTRKQLQCGSSSGGNKANSVILAWTVYPAHEIISHVSLWDASSGGNCLEYGPLTSAVEVLLGNTLNIPIGNLLLTLV